MKSCIVVQIFGLYCIEICSIVVVYRERAQISDLRFKITAEYLADSQVFHRITSS